MRGASSQRTQDSAFARYMRYGRRAADPAGATIAGGVSGEGAIELKFNPNHDPRDGRFTSGPSGGQSGGGVSAPKTAGSAASKKRFQPDPELGVLSAQHESSGRGPGTVSTGQGDDGGVSYGTYQLATNTGDAAAFVASEAAKPWARDFAGLKPGTKEFRERWQAVAQRDPKAFEAAQHAYIFDTHYKPAVLGVERGTGYDLNGASDAVRNVTWSIAVQHGKAVTILSDAVRRTDKILPRSSGEYQAALINNMYDRRIEYVRHIRDRQLAANKPAQAKASAKIIEGRYPQERAEALEMLRKGHVR